MLWEDKVILSSLKKRILRKDLLVQLKRLEEDIRKERTSVVRPGSFFRCPDFLKKAHSQDDTAQKPRKVGIAGGAGDESAEKQPDVNVVQEMLFTDGSLDMEKLLCLHLLAKQIFINRIRRTQAHFQNPRHVERARGVAAGIGQERQAADADALSSPGHGYAVDLGSISFMSDKVHLTSSQPAVNGSHRKKMLPQVSSADVSCQRPEEHVEQLVDSVLEALCEANPTKLCTLRQMESDENTLSHVLGSRKMQRFLQQVCGREMRGGAPPPVPRREAGGVPAMWGMQQARWLTAKRQLSDEELRKLERKLLDTGFRVDLLVDIEHTIDELWHQEVACKRSGEAVRGEALWAQFAPQYEQPGPRMQHANVRKGAYFASVITDTDTTAEGQRFSSDCCHHRGSQGSATPPTPSQPLTPPPTPHLQDATSRCHNVEKSETTSDKRSRKLLYLSSPSSSSSDSSSVQVASANAEPVRTGRNHQLAQMTTQHRSWQQQLQQASSLLGRLSAAMSTHSTILHQKVKSDVWHAEIISSGEKSVLQ